MQTALSIIGIVFLCLLVFFGALVGAFIYVGTRLDTSSKAYVDHTLPLILANWSQDELEQQESPGFRAATSTDKLTKLVAYFSQLGPMQSYGGCKGDSNISFFAGQGLLITAVYEATATFQNGTASIRVALVRQDSHWKINALRIDSPYFMKPGTEYRPAVPCESRASLAWAW